MFEMLGVAAIGFVVGWIACEIKVEVDRSKRWRD
jgi:hypothetical protein